KGGEYHWRGLICSSERSSSWRRKPAAPNWAPSVGFVFSDPLINRFLAYKHSAYLDRSAAFSAGGLPHFNTCRRHPSNSYRIQGNVAAISRATSCRMNGIRVDISHRMRYVDANPAPAVLTATALVAS